jgi:hypothetical protein
MTKPCRNVCGAQQLMKPAFSAPLMRQKQDAQQQTRSKDYKQPKILDWI